MLARAHTHTHIYIYIYIHGVRFSTIFISLGPFGYFKTFDKHLNMEKITQILENVGRCK